jgi:hypothetical protein
MTKTYAKNGAKKQESADKRQNMTTVMGTLRRTRADKGGQNYGNSKNELNQ